LRPKTVDFHAIPDSQAGIHERLLNWARWCFSGQVQDCAPMFSGYRSTEVWAAPEASTPVDKLDAQRIEKSVCALPYNHKHALRWFYVAPFIRPAKTAHTLGLTLEVLAMTVIQARDRVLTHATNPVSVSPTRKPIGTVCAHPFGGGGD
jgi:hypothetical protein